MGAQCACLNAAALDTDVEVSVLKLKAPEDAVNTSSAVSTIAEIDNEDEDSTEACDLGSMSTQSTTMIPHRVTRANSAPCILTTISRLEGTLEDAYDVGEQIGQGGFGTVHVAIDRATGARRAAKILIKMNDAATQLARGERKSLSGLDHPHVVRLWASFEDAHRVSLVMDCCSGGDLLERLQSRGRFPENDVRLAMKQVLSAVRYLHRRDIVHRDVKLDNFLYLHEGQDNTLKLIDLGLATRCPEGEFLDSVVGTLDYMAPQIHKKKYNRKCDLWSSGVVMFALLGGYMPFAGASRKDIIENVLLGRWDFFDQAWLAVSEDAKSLIRGLLETQSRKRLCAEKANAHTWLRSQDESQGPISSDILANMRAYGGIHKLKKTVLMLIAAHTDDKRLQSLKEQFIEMDLDGDGELSAGELRTALARCGLKETEAEQVVKGVDANDDGKLQYTEFLSATLSIHNLSAVESAVKKVFTLLDINGDGYITLDELRLFRTSRLFTEGPDWATAGDLEVPSGWTASAALDLEQFTSWLRSSSVEEWRPPCPRRPPAPTM